MAQRKRTASKTETVADETPVDTEEIKAKAAIPNSLVPGSNFASRRAARMKARG